MLDRISWGILNLVTVLTGQTIVWRFEKNQPIFQDGNGFFSRFTPYATVYAAQFSSLLGVK
jgi:hypothetical protein